MTAASPVVVMRGVGRSFPSPKGDVEVLHGIDLAIESCAFLMITGPSGSGKTTLLNLASLMDTPSAGRVEFMGEDVSGLEDERLCRLRGSHVGCVFQRFCLLPHRSVLENVMLRFRYTGTPSEEAETRSLEALQAVGLRDIVDRKARLLSAGETQRVAIARAVALKPDLLAADEPTGNLDAVSAGAVMACFDELHRGGITIVMVTHNEALLRHATQHRVCTNGSLE